MAASDEQERPAKKKRKIRDSRSILEDAKRSDIKLCSTEQVVGNWKDRELWVFQLPKDCDLNTLDQQKIQLNGVTEVKKEGSIYEIRPFQEAQKCLSSQNYVVLSPSSKAGKLQKGPRLQGYMQILRSVSASSVKIPTPSTDHKVITPHGLKKRWKPFGYRAPTSPS